MRERIVAAAVACDYDELAALALPGDFTYTFGGGEDPASFWRAAEREGEEPLLTLVRLLDMSWTTRAAGGTKQYVWPTAYAAPTWDDVSGSERDELRTIYSDEDLARFEQFGAYAGYRVGIDADGDWAFFVAGD